MYLQFIKENEVITFNNYMYIMNYTGYGSFPFYWTVCYFVRWEEITLALLMTFNLPKLIYTEYKALFITSDLQV